jgi:cytochrome P450
LPFTTYRKACLARESVVKRLVKIVEERRLAIKTLRIKPLDLLQSMIDTPDPETGELADTDSIAKNSVTIITAAIDTTASAVASMLRILFVNTEVRDKVITECRAVWPNDKPLHTLSSEEISIRLVNMTYLDAVIQETLRVRSPLNGTARFAVADVHIPDTDYIIPKGCQVMVSHDYCFTTDEKNFRQADKFMPERFLPDGGSYACANYKGSAFPFSKGVHMCPGSKFAIAEAKIIISQFALECSTWPEIIDTDKRFTMGIAGDGVQGQRQVPSLEEIGGMHVKFFV